MPYSKQKEIKYSHDWINNKKKYNEPGEVVRNIPGTSVLVGNHKSCDLFGKNIQSDVGS